MISSLQHESIELYNEYQVRFHRLLDDSDRIACVPHTFFLSYDVTQALLQRVETHIGDRSKTSSLITDIQRIINELGVKSDQISTLTSVSEM